MSTTPRHSNSIKTPKNSISQNQNASIISPKLSKTSNSNIIELQPRTSFQNFINIVPSNENSSVGPSYFASTQVQPIIHTIVVPAIIDETNKWHFVRAYHTGDLYTDWMYYLSQSPLLLISLFFYHHRHPIKTFRRIYRYTGLIPLIGLMSLLYIGINQCPLDSGSNSVLQVCVFNWGFSWISALAGFKASLIVIGYSILIEAFSTLFWSDWRDMIADRRFSVIVNSIEAPSLNMEEVDFMCNVSKNAYWTCFLSLPTWIVFLAVVTIVSNSNFSGDAPWKVFFFCWLFCEILHYCYDSIEFVIKFNLEIRASLEI